MTGVRRWLDRVLAWVPLGLGAAVVVVCSLLLIANLVLASAGFGPIKISRGLDGMTKRETIPWSETAMLDGRTQAAIAHSIGQSMPLYQDAVRLRNQWFYSVLGTSPIPGVLLGRDHELLELPYAEDWCSRNIATWRPGALQWAASIRRMQDLVEARGHTFLYLLTPSKVAQYPGFLPQNYSCPAPLADQTGLVPEWVGLLREAGVHLADTTATLAAARPDYPFALFPPGGTHWNAVGAALAMQRMLLELDRLRPAHGYAPFQFTWHMEPRATGSDVDLARLTNLFSHPWAVPVPAVSFKPAPPPPVCRAERVVVVGGSFGHAAVATQPVLPCGVSVTEYEYWHITTVTWEGGDYRLHPVDPAQRDAAVRSADVLIYEENEEILRHPDTGRALLALLDGSA